MLERTIQRLFGVRAASIGASGGTDLDRHLEPHRPDNHNRHTRLPIRRYHVDLHNDRD